MKTLAPTRAFWGRVALAALWLHGAWEAAQCALFYAMSDVSPPSGLIFMAVATLADVILTLFLLFLALRLSAARDTSARDTSARDTSVGFPAPIALLWSVGLGALAAIAIEIPAQTGGWWRYSDAMPTIFVLGTPIGVLPLLQMAILPPICLLLASKRRGFR